METQFFVQDPNDPETTYLYESIIEQVMLDGLINWRGLYSFATGGGVSDLFVDDPVVSEYIRNGTVSMVVGVDAVTNVSALEELMRLNNEIKKFDARVFFNPGDGLFHPKVSHFEYHNGQTIVIIGSGNLTPGGLRTNIEAYSVISGTKDEFESLVVWDRFLQRHSDNIRPIDTEALERARVNQSRFKRRRRREVPTEQEGITAEVLAATEEELDKEIEAIQASRVLIARVPAAGNRWHQIHYNRDVVEQFFNLRINSSQRVFLQYIDKNGKMSPVEVRPLVYSSTNKNYKIEVSARREDNYPIDNSPPIIVVREIGTRVYNYTLLMLRENGYAEMNTIIERNPSIGKGLSRVIVKYSEVTEAWSNCTL